MIPHNRPTLGSAEAAAAQRVLDSGWLAQGAEVARFEEELCDFLGVPEGCAVAVSSGSAALYLAVQALGGNGCEVSLPGYSCRALWNAVSLASGQARWLDTANGVPGISPDELARTTSPLAIVAHMYGIPVRLPGSYRARIIEDCAQAIGARVDGALVGTAGDIGIFSFGATKPITSGGQGGMVVARDRSLTDFVREARDYDTTMDRHPRFNFQMTDLQAAIGRVQLTRLPEFIERRQAIYECYQAWGLPLVDGASAGTQPLRFRAVVQTQRPAIVRERLRKRGIATIVPVTQEELLASPDALPNARALCERTVSLPVFPTLTADETAQVAEATLWSLEP